jgi:hypothetical protein
VCLAREYQQGLLQRMPVTQKLVYSKTFLYSEYGSAAGSAPDGRRSAIRTFLWLVLLFVLLVTPHQGTLQTDDEMLNLQGFKVQHVQTTAGSCTQRSSNASQTRNTNKHREH